MLATRTTRQPRRRPPVVVAAVFVACACVSWLWTRTGHANLYTPLTSQQYTPPPQPHDDAAVVIRNSIVVPTYHEQANIRPLCERVFASVQFPKETELVIVDDDSRDGTEHQIDLLKQQGYNVQLLVRKRGSERGLSSAVLRGFEVARGSKLVVMDADLQHPPETIQPLLDSLSAATPIAIGTRYGPGVSMSKRWPMYRRVISWGARILARPLTSASDPMTGFFGILKDQFLASAPINTSGFKIALELLLKSPLKSGAQLKQVPYSFGVRKLGASKLSSKVMLRYVGQLLTLYAWAWGVWFHLLIGTGAAAAAAIAMSLFDHAQARRHVQELLPGGSTRRGLLAQPSLRSRVPLESKRLV
ncbi:hypothetical protein OIV83_002947 [Microbotryomycetes sp. JL201]|nr:hypothetical protein OIV83_002947 [Microbotryomycetes sp. JL201]